MRVVPSLRVAALLAAALVFAPVGCGGEDDDLVYPVETRPLTPGGEVIPPRASVTLQLKGPPQAQFAGYYAAEAKGFFKERRLDVTIAAGGPKSAPEQAVASGRAEFGIGWLAALLAARDQGRDLVNIAQVFARSGKVELAWRDSGARSLERADVAIADQPFDLRAFLRRRVQATPAMTYDELADVLETHTLDDVRVVSMEETGTALLEDGVFVDGDWIAEPAHRDIAVRFLEASFEGWAFCRDNAEECLRIVLDRGKGLDAAHQRWQLNEINALIWPNESGIGLMDREDFERTAELALRFGVIDEPASTEAYRDDLAILAVTELGHHVPDLVGMGWEKASVRLSR